MPFKLIATSPFFVSINTAGTEFLAPSNGRQQPLQLPVSNQGNFQGRGVAIGGSAPQVQPYRQPVVTNAARSQNTVVVNPAATASDPNM